MILAGYILKDKKVFSNFIAPLSLKEKNTLNRLKKFKPNKKVFEAESDTSFLGPLGDAPKSYLLGWVGSSSKSDDQNTSTILFPNMTILSHRFILYNSEFVLILVIKEKMIRTSKIQNQSGNSNEGQVTIQIGNKVNDNTMVDPIKDLIVGIDK